MEEVGVCFLCICNFKKIAISDDPEFQKWVYPSISKLIPMLLNSRAPRSLREKVAIAVGKIGLMHPGIVAPCLPEFAQAWCQALSEIHDDEEKDSAFRGLCMMIQVNPAGITKASVFYHPFTSISSHYDYRAYLGSATQSFIGNNRLRN